MSKDFSAEQSKVVTTAVELYKVEIMKMFKKAEKLGLEKEQESLKKKFLEAEKVLSDLG